MTIEQIIAGLQQPGFCIRYRGAFNNYYLDCSQSTSCSNCMFVTGEPCSINDDRDIITPDQLDYLQQHHPEFFI